MHKLQIFIYILDTKIQKPKIIEDKYIKHKIILTKVPERSSVITKVNDKGVLDNFDIMSMPIVMQGKELQ